MLIRRLSCLFFLNNCNIMIILVIMVMIIYIVMILLLILVGYYMVSIMILKGECNPCN